MIVASVSADGRPSARVVLLKALDERGFTFYTNLHSRKAGELLGHPVAALCFYWQKLQRQVRIEGRVERVSDEEADAYFATRPRGSQLSAWASEQSAPLSSREALEQKLSELEARYAGKPVPRPPHWSGLRVVPDAIEFWEGRPNRLHHRLRYERDRDAWRSQLLNP
jgi:pyridoxamine 5'-phosphate oxidase